jgi:hypothetical protein
VCSKLGNSSKEVRAQPTKTCILINGDGGDGDGGGGDGGVIRSDPIQIPTVHFEIMSTCHGCGWADESIDVTDIFNIDATDISNILSLSLQCF